MPAALERSRSGKGGHIWIFFDRALPAITARKLGCRDSHANDGAQASDSASIPTIAFSLTRTRCLREGSGT